MRSLIRRLTPAEVDTYDVIDPELSRRVVLVQLPALPGPYDGLTIGRLVVLGHALSPDRPEPLMAHELVHVGQFHDQGFLRFTLRYNADFARNLVRFRRWGKAYRAIPAEVEARAGARQWLDRTYPDRKRL